MSYVVLRQDLTEGKPLDPPVVVTECSSVKGARSARRARALVWVHLGHLSLDRDDLARRSWENRGRSVLAVDHGPPIGLEVVAYYYVEDRRPVKPADLRWAVEFQGSVVQKCRTKAQAAKALTAAIDRWVSARYPRHMAYPARPRSAWPRQVLHFYLKDRGTYAGEALISPLRRKGR